MNTRSIATPLAVWLLVMASASAADPFDCGSTGAYGAMNITEDVTLDLPADGIFHCTTITVASGRTLRFNRNPLNTPVCLLAQGDVVIEGSIDVSASGRLGGPGGFDGGFGQTAYAGSLTAGDGHGPGGGRTAGGFSGAFGGPSGDGNTRVYGNLLCSPLIGGSGAAASGSVVGGGGGGAILIASNTGIMITGSVVSRGSQDSSYFGTGSGGAVRLVAPIVGGSGMIDTGSQPSNSWQGGVGRVRIDCTDDLAYLSLNVAGVASRGWRMFVFPAVIPKLDIIEVAGQVIPVGASSGVQILLPKEASPNQTVIVQARDFTADVPIRVVVTPKNGPSASFDGTILESSGSPPSATVDVVIPPGSVSQIHVWTR